MRSTCQRFKAAVTEGGTWGIMGAYNLYQNQHNCHNNIMLNQILKGDWQYDGVVVSDWGGCHNTEEAIENGLDLEFGSWTDGLTMGKTNAYDLYFMADAYKQLIKQGKYTTEGTRRQGAPCAPPVLSYDDEPSEAFWFPLFGEPL